MRANFMHLLPLIQEVLASGVPGDLAEFGVWHATTFMPMAELARTSGRRIHAIDSFRGMGPGGPRDGDEYREGALDAGGSAVFRDLAKPFGGTILLHEGYVPSILPELADVRFAFVHLDLDHYQPTLDVLRFAWPRISVGGILAAHDWFPETDTLCSGAIRDWMAESGRRIAGETPGRHAWFRKEAE